MHALLFGVTAILLCTTTGSPLVKSGNFSHIYNPSATLKWYINDHTFVLGPGNTWHLIGITHSEPADPTFEVNLAHATSVNNLTRIGWTKQPFALGAIPPKQTHLWAPYILHHNGLFYMFYCGGGSDRTAAQIQLATSTDLWAWKRVKTLITGGVDGRDPVVLNLGPNFDNKWALYYTGTSPDVIAPTVSHVIYVLTSTDLLNWENETIAFDAGTTGHSYGGPTESPFVVRRGDSFYLFCGSWVGYSETRVFQSKDPFNFGNIQKKTQNQVGTIPSHAAEVVRDTDGKWYVSRCGWEQGGVYLAPLTWMDGLDKDNSSLPIPSSGAAIAPRFNTNLGKAWYSVGGSWVLTPEGLQGMEATSNGFYMAKDTAVPQNFVLQADITLTTSNGDPKAHSDSAGALVFRSKQNPNTGSAVVTMQTETHPGAGILKLFLFGPYRELYTIPFNVSATATYHMEVKVMEVDKMTNIRVSVGVGGGVPVEYMNVNSTELLPSGYVGVNLWQAAVTYQNVLYKAT